MGEDCWPQSGLGVGLSFGYGFEIEIRFGEGMPLDHEGAGSLFQEVRDGGLILALHGRDQTYSGRWAMTTLTSSNSSASKAARASLLGIAVAIV